MALFSAVVRNSLGKHAVTLSTNDRQRTLEIAPAASGYGSSANGGELLLLALATCYCNDIYREAAQRQMTVHSVEVTAEAEFGPVSGNVAQHVRYHARVEAAASEAEIAALMRHTDTVAEIQNTLRQPVEVTLATIEAVAR